MIAGSVGTIQAIWSLFVALIVSSIAACIGRKHYTEGEENFFATINFGLVMVSMPGFLPIKEMLLNLGD